MKNYYLVVDGYDFHTPRNTFLACFLDGKIENIANVENIMENIKVDNIENFVGDGESLEYNLITIENEKLKPFYYAVETLENDNSNKTPKIELILKFDVNMPKSNIIEIMNYIMYEKAYEGMKISYEISESTLYYKTVDEVNKELERSGTLRLNEEGELCYPEMDKELPSISSAKEIQCQIPCIDIDADDIPF